jgi:hypothetical protein
LAATFRMSIGQKHTTFQPDPLAARNPPRKVQSLII